MPDPNVSPDCTELGRTTRIYVTGYNLCRVASTRVRRFAKRCLVADFNGAIPKGSLITQVTWECTSPWSTIMSNPRVIIGQRKVAVDVSFNFAGWGGVKASVLLDNGETYNAEGSFTVLDAPLYPSATYDSANGPYQLVSVV